MRYVMRQKAWSWGDNYTIKNEAGADVFLVNSRAFSFRKQLSFQDMQGHELALIAQKRFTWAPTYEITSRGRLAGVVRKKLFTFFRCRFTIDVPGPNDLIAEGDFFHNEYTFTLHGEPVAQISKRWFTWTDTYGIDVADGQDDVLFLATAVVIDLVCHHRGH